MARNNLFVTTTNVELPNNGGEVKSRNLVQADVAQSEATAKFKDSIDQNKLVEQAFNDTGELPDLIPRNLLMDALRANDAKLVEPLFKLTDDQWWRVSGVIEPMDTLENASFAYGMYYNDNVKEHQDQIRASQINMNDPNMALVRERQEETGSKTLGAVLALDNKIDLASAKLSRYNETLSFVTNWCGGTDGRPGISMGDLKNGQKKSLFGAIIRGLATSLSVLDGEAHKMWAAIMNCKDTIESLSDGDISTIVDVASRKGSPEIAGITLKKASMFTNPAGCMADGPDTFRNMLGRSKTGASLYDVTDALDEVGIPRNSLVAGPSGSVNHINFQTLTGKPNALSTTAAPSLAKRTVKLQESKQRDMFADNDAAEQHRHALGAVADMDEDEVDRAHAVLEKSKRGELPYVAVDDRGGSMSRLAISDKGDAVSSITAGSSPTGSAVILKYRGDAANTLHQLNCNGPIVDIHDKKLPSTMSPEDLIQQSRDASTLSIGEAFADKYSRMVA